MMYNVLAHRNGRLVSVWQGETYAGASRYVRERVGTHEGRIVKETCECDLGEEPCGEHVKL